MKQSITLGIMCAAGFWTTAHLAVSAQTKPPAGKPRVEYRWDVQKSGVQEHLYAVFFLDTSLGWAAGDSNTILKTTDGGKTWTLLTEQQKGGNRFESIRFTSPTDGWVQSPTGGALLHTSDGGESWQPAAKLPQGFGFGRAGSVRRGVREQLAGSHVYRTRDGGRTWTLLGELPQNDYDAVFFLDDQNGWAAGGMGRTASTRDGGKTWTEQTPAAGSLIKVQFVTPQLGWALPHRGHSGGVLASTDGGATWTAQYAGVRDSAPLTDMQFLDAQHGFLLAEGTRGAVVYATTNGGKNWRTIGTVHHYSAALSFPDVDEGWVVGRDGYIVHYHRVAPRQ
jgi:photosystem II stability/assembly factor-like uncharacterized protein